MKRDPINDRMYGGNPGERSAQTAPLAFPSADGPGRPAAAGDGRAGPVPAVERAWPLMPVLTAAMCAVAMVSVVLHDGLGLRAIEQAVAAAQRDRIERALQAIEVKFRLQADNARDVALLLSRAPSFQDASHNARDRQAMIEQAMRQSGVDRIALVPDAGTRSSEPVSSASVGTALTGIGTPARGAAILHDRDGEPVFRFAERVGADQAGWGWLVVERGLSGQMVRDLSAALGVDIRLADEGGTLISTSAADTGCFGADRLAAVLARRTSPWGAEDSGSDCIARSASVGGLRVALLAQVTEDAGAPGLAGARRQFGWIAALTLAVAALAGMLLARRMARPVRALSSRAGEQALRYTGRAVEHSRNEMKELAAAFEAMTAAMLAQFERLQGLHLDEMQNSLELQRRYALMRLLRDLSSAANESETMQQTFERALEELGAYLDWPIGRALIVEDPRDRDGPGLRSIWFAAERKRFTRFIAECEGLPMDPSAQGLIGRARVTGMPHWVTDLSRLESWRRRDLAVQSGLKSGFVIPVTVGGEVSAFIEFFADHRVEASAEMIELIEAIHTELWQAGERHQGHGANGAVRGGPAVPVLDPLGAVSR